MNRPITSNSSQDDGKQKENSFGVFRSPLPLIKNACYGEQLAGSSAVVINTRLTALLVQARLIGAWSLL